MKHLQCRGREGGRERRVESKYVCDGGCEEDVRGCVERVCERVIANLKERSPTVWCISRDRLDTPPEGGKNNPSNCRDE